MMCFRDHFRRAAESVAGAEVRRFGVERGVRMRMYLFDCLFDVALLRGMLLRAEMRWMEEHVRWVG